MAWPRTPLAALLGLDLPIVQAPMAGCSTPALAAAVSEAGGLGSLGCAEFTVGELPAVIAELRARTRRPFNLNFFAHPAPPADPAGLGAVTAWLAPFYAEQGLGLPPASLPAGEAGFSSAALTAILADPPPVVSFHFGLPSSETLARLRAAGCKVLSTATSVAEARALEAAGADAIIAQGWEAGGHRGAVAVEDTDAGVGLMALLPQAVDAVRVPVIAAGGIADGRGIAAALALGAGGVQIGTAFLFCPEARVAPAHRHVLDAAQDTDTRLTRAFSGRPARAMRTRYTEAARGRPVAPFPLMYALSAPLSATGDEERNRDFRLLLAGQAGRLGRRMAAADPVRTLDREARAALARLAGET
jgi:nitronate monooxygenase